MELNLQKIQQLDTQQILKIIFPTINNIYKTIDYVGITKEDFNNLVLKEISESKTNYKDDITYIKYIENKINIILDEQIKEKLLQQETAITIINNYINKNFKQSISYKNSINNFEKLGAFFENYNYIPNPNILLQIIEENSVFSKMIESVIKKHKTQIISGDLYMIFDNSTIISIIETYCMLHNIEIKESQDFDDNEIDLENLELTDSIKVYLQEISKRPLLLFEEEQELAHKIAQGDSYAKKIFIESNLRLVVSIAKKYTGNNISFLDLIQEGNIGLMTAVDKYDVNRGIKFSTYATYWIKQAIIKVIAEKGRNIKISIYTYEKLGLYKKAVAKLEESLNRQPTIEEIAKEMRLPIKIVKNLPRMQNDTISLNYKISDDEKSEFENFVSEETQSIENIIIENDMQQQVKDLLQKCNLKQRDLEILMLRFGFNGQDPLPLRDVAKKFNLSPERIRQIELITLERIRKSKYIRNFAEYMQNPTQALEKLDYFRRNSEFENQNKEKSYEEPLEDTKNDTRPKTQTIYQYLKEYSKELVDKALEKLNEEEKTIIAKFKEEQSNQLSIEQKHTFYKVLIPKIRKIISNLNEEMISRKNKEIKTIPSAKNMTIPRPIKVRNINIPNNEILKQREVKNISIISEVSSKTQTDKDITPEDYKKTLEFLKATLFKQMKNVLTDKEAIIISLKLGYIDGKYFSNDSIANFLGIEKQEVINTTKKILLLYKNNINQLTNNVIEIATEQTKQLTKKPSN